jgi:methyl-accepting chemotaxis protein
MSSNTSKILHNIEEMLLAKQQRIDKITVKTIDNREKLQKINEALDKEQQRLLDLLVRLTYTAEDIDKLDEVSNQSELSSSIEDISHNMRKIRKNLAGIIRKDL